MIIFLVFSIFLVLAINIPYPTSVDNKDPNKTPILTSSIKGEFGNARLPTNKLIVNPIPVRTPTAYKFTQEQFFGLSAQPNLIAAIEKALANRQSVLSKGNGYGKVENNS